MNRPLRIPAWDPAWTAPVEALALGPRVILICGGPGGGPAVEALSREHHALPVVACNAAGADHRVLALDLRAVVGIDDAWWTMSASPTYAAARAEWARRDVLTVHICARASRPSRHARAAVQTTCRTRRWPPWPASLTGGVWTGAMHKERKEGGNTGLAALQILDALGVEEVVVIGADLGHGDRSRGWWHAGYGRKQGPPATQYARWLRQWEMAREHLRCRPLIASPSALSDRWERVTLPLTT